MPPRLSGPSLFAIVSSLRACDLKSAAVGQFLIVSLSLLCCPSGFDQVLFF